MRSGRCSRRAAGCSMPPARCSPARPAGRSTLSLPARRTPCPAARSPCCPVGRTWMGSIMLASTSRTWRALPFTRNSNGFFARAGGSRPLQRALVLLALFAVPFFAAAQDEDLGHFEVRSANVELRSGVYFLSADIDYRLSGESRERREDRVVLRMRRDVEREVGRRFWFDNTVATPRQRYQLESHALCERFLVNNLSCGEQASSSTLRAALDYLGRVR